MPQFPNPPPMDQPPELDSPNPEPEVVHTPVQPPPPEQAHPLPVPETSAPPLADQLLTPMQQAAVAPPVPLPQPTLEQEIPVAAPQKKTLAELLNNIRCDNIALTDGIPLGDALERLAAAISRSGFRYDDHGNPTHLQINKGLGEILLEALQRTPRTVDVVPVQLGFDPNRPMFMVGEALSLPMNSEMVMLLKKDEPAPVFPDTDDPQNATSAR